MSTLNPFEDPNFDGSVKQGTPNPFADPNFSGRDGALVRGAKTMSKNVGISAGLVSGDTAETAKRVAELDAYSKLNPKSKERQALGDAFEKGDGFFGGLKGAVNQIGENYNKAGSFVGGLRSLGRDAYAMGEAVVEQTPNMLLPTAGMIAGGAAGSYVPVVGTAIGAFAGGAAGNTMVEGGSQVMDALAKANINPSDTAAVKAYLDKNGDKILGQSAVKGSVLGAVDVATAGLGHGILNAPIKEATGRALKEMGVDMADKAAVKAAMNSPAMAERLGADAILKQQSTGLRNIGRNAGAAALEPAGEFTGEFVGQGLATGDWDTKGAGLEALSSIGQSGAMYAGQKAVQFATAPKISIDNTQQQSDGTQPPVAQTTTPGAPPVATPPAGPTLGQSLTGTPMADLMGGSGLTGGANPLQAGLSTLTSNNQMYPGMNTEPTGYTVDPETGAIIPADPVGVRQMAEPAAQVEAPAPVAQAPVAPAPVPPALGESLTGTPVADMLDTRTPSQRMGLNPESGGLTAAAAIAVDSGASPATAGMGLRALSGLTEVTPIERTAGQIGTPRRLGESPIIDVQAREVSDPELQGQQSRIGMTPRIGFDQPQGTHNATQAAKTQQAAPQQQGTQSAIGGVQGGANAMPVAEGLGASSAPAVQGGPIPAVQVQQGVASHVTAGSKPSKADNLAALQQKLAGQKKPTPTTPPAQTKATPAPEAGPTNQGATNGQRQETLLKAEQPTGARTVNAAPVADGVKGELPIPATFKSLIGKKSTTVLSDDGRGRILYEVDVPAQFRAKNFVNGRLPGVDGLELREKSSVTGNPYDNGYVLIDSRKQLQDRRAADLPKSELTTPKADGAKPSGAPVAEHPASKAENLAKIRQASQAGKKDAAQSDYWSNPKLNSHEHGGRADFKAGKPRTLPGYFTEPRGGNAKAWLRGWDKAKADSEMAPAKDSAPAKPPAPTQPATGRKPVGKNEDGKQLEQDERGVRSYVEDGIRITEPVAMRPGRAGVSVSVENRRDEFKTVDELGQKAAAPTQSTETLMQAAKNNGKLVVANVGDKPSAKPAAPAPAADSILDDELKDALGKLGDVLGDVFGSKLNVTGPQYTAGDLLPALSKVVELLVKKGFKSFSQSIGKAAQLMRADQRTAAHVDSISPRQWKAAYNAIADGFEGTDSEDAISALKSDEVLAIVAPKVAQKPEAPSIQNAAQAKTLAESLYQAIKANQMPKDNPALKKLVEAFDGKPADQARMKQAQESLETAITMMARDLVAKKEGNRSTFDMLLRLYESQPNLNIRTSTSIANQAYSTPAPLAWLASQLAGITKDTVAHEPTGGNGMLLIAADPSKAIVNELNDLRIDALKAQGFKPTQKDAATQQLVPDGVKPDSVVANPPFGSIKDADGKPVKVKVDGFSLGQIDHLIAARALDTMKDDGRATLIIGANKVSGGLSTDDRIFFNWLYSHYNVAGHFEVEGDLYNRQGAGWPVRVITINGRQKSDKFSPVAGAVQRVDNWNAVYEQFTKSLESSKNQAVIGTTTADDGAGARPSITAATPAKAGEGKPTGGTSSTGNVSGASAGAVSNRAEPAAIAVGDSPDEQRINAQPFVQQPQPGQNPEGAARPEKPVGTTAVSEAKGNEFQAPYTPRSARKDDGVLIPSNMAQPTQDALSKLEDEVGDIDEFARKELGYATVADLHNALMGLQVDSVATSIYQIKKGKAVVIADQTGIGKGRQAASIIRWAALQGMTPVFVSVKPSLFTDMYGDLADIGTNDVSPFIMNGDAWVAGEGGSKLFANKPGKHKQAIQEIANSGQLPEGSNALFMTYSQINVANVQRQALMALAPNAVFVLDESHNAAGASSTGEFVISALEAAKGVVYLSATYAKRPDNMPLYFKTDIGEAAADTEGLADAMASGGLPLQTVVSNNLVKAGQMFRRERSYEGVSIASVFDSPNRALHERMSNEATKALRAIASADSMFHEVYVKQLSEQLAESGATVIDSAGNQIEQSVQHTEFSSVVHNFVKQMLLGLKAQSAADEAIASLKRGEKPIIAVENTMGSFLTEYAAANGIGQGDSLGSFDYRTVLTRALARSRVVIEVAPNGDKVKRQVRFDQLDPVTQAAYRDAQAVIDGLTLNIPVSPIDWMRSEIIRAGFKVAEITGRNLSVDYGNPKKPVLSAIDATEQKDKVNTTRQFNSGSLDALILNVAGSTGISLHASEKFADQRQRHMIVAQAAGDINIFMQMLGRVHRTGQVRLPKYTILSVDLPTEKRPTAVLSIKMKSLNANTSSNTESATSVKSLDILNKYGDQIVNQYLSDNYALARELGLESDIGENPTEDIARKATGRLALQPIDTQHAFYDDVEAQYTALIDYLNKTNQNDLEPRTFDFDAKETRQEVLFDGPDKDSPFGEDAIYGEYSIKAQGSPMKPDEIRAAMSENLGGMLPVAHTQKMLDELDAKFNAYWSTLDDGGKDSASSVRSVGRDFLREHRIGSTFRVDINSEPFNAVVLNVRNMHKETGNPYSMSKIQVTVAVNGALRSISVPATQFRKIEVSSISPSFRVEQLFKEQPPNQRETAKIVTGNLLAAYGELQGVRGTIINFTKQDGTVDQGILLPKLFDYTKNTRGDYHLKDGESALKFLQKSENKDVGRFGIMTRDGNVRVLPSGQGIRVQVPKSKLKGAKYFLDKGLIEVGGDFVTQGAYMVATVQNPSDAVKMLDLLMKKQALYTLPSMAEEAKAITVSKPEGATDANQKPSVSRAKEQPLTPAPTIRAAITKAYGNLLDKLEAKGLVTIAQTEREAIEAAAQARADKTGGDVDAIASRMMSLAGVDVKYSANGNIEGFFDKQTGKSFLVADNLTAASAPGTLMHEVGIHMAAGGKMAELFKRAGTLLKTGTQNEFIQRVKARMDRAGETSDEEAAAYIVTEYENDRAKAPITIGKWLADLTAAVRAWLFSNGIVLKAEQLTVADIAAVARANARSMARGGPSDGAGGGQSFSRQDQEIRFSRAADIAGNAIDKAKQTADKAMGKDFPRAASMPDLNDDQRSLLGKVGASQSPASDAIKAATDRAGLKIRQGMVDRFAALKELDEKALGQNFIADSITNSAWVLAKMSSAGSGALNAMMKTGRIEMDAQQKVIGLKGAPNGGLTASLQKLGGPAEVERFFAWVAANRSHAIIERNKEAIAKTAEAKRELKNIIEMQAIPGKTAQQVSQLSDARKEWEKIIAKHEPFLDVTERLFTEDEVAAGRTLNTGTTEEGKVRPALYSQVHAEFQQYRDDVLAIAEQTGIINSDNRAMWRDEFYVPFYRVMEDDADRGRSGGNGLSRQEAYKKLKGGKQNLNDLMENTLMNFHHLLSASLKNQAAVQAIKNAEHVGIARKVPEARRDTKTSTFVLVDGKKVFYEVDDPLVFESITTLADPGLNNTAVRVMGAFKRLFTNMTTATPQFIIANTFRDLLQASSTSPTSKNIAKNLKEGIQSYRDEKTRAEMLASGGAFSFGHIYGMGADEVKESLQKTVAGAGLISSQSMIPSILRKGWGAWSDITDLSENASRAATYTQNVDELGKLRAAFEARDVMDFSQHGAWPAVRLLVRIVPFLNARLQGLDKLYRSGLKPSILTAMGKGTDTDKQAAARFAMVTGALTLATMALYLVNADDDEYKKLEEWQKDTYWFIRIGENAFFLPKPFEVGAIATIAERTLQQAMDDKATGKLFRERMWDMLMQTFAFNPTPQMFQPLIDVYSNKDAFTGRDIESAGMERMSTGLRSRDTTTAPATALSAVSRVFGDESSIAVSPVQADHLIKGYLGGVGATAAGWIDTMYRAATGQSSPDKAWSEYQPIRRFYRDLDVPVANTRYTTLFFDGLKEANRVYADVMELQKLGRPEDAATLAAEKRNVLQMRIALNAQQRRLTEINNRMKEVRRSDKDGEWKRREIDLLTTQKAMITERMGKRIEDARVQ